MQCLACGILHPSELDCNNINKELIQRVARKIRDEGVGGETSTGVSREVFREQAVSIATCMLLHRAYHNNFESITTLLEDDELFWRQVDLVNDITSLHIEEKGTTNTKNK